jgi:multiple sugar transport system substrate-binding protein
MHFPKKLTSFLVLMIFLVTLGLGCKQPPIDQQIAEKQVTLEYWTVYDDVDELNKLIEQYTAQRSYLHINLKQIPASEFYQRLIEALAEDRGPDIISIQNRMLPGMKTKLAPMPASVSDTIIIQGGGLIGPGQTIQSSVHSLITPSQVESEYVRAVPKDVVIDGRVYGLPLSIDTLAIFYNKDLLDRAGVAQVPTTWKDFQEAVRKITKYDSKGKLLQSGTALGTGNNVTGVDDLLFILFKQNSIPFVTDSGRPLFNQIGQDLTGDGSPIAHTLNFYTDFANPTRDTYSWNENQPAALDAFTNGSLGFFFGYSYHLPVIKAKAPQLNFGVIPLFQLNPENKVNVANYWVQAVTLKSKHQNEAWGFIDFLAHSSATKDYLDTTGRPTALRRYIPDQAKKLELAPFVSDLLIADNWYRGTNYVGALGAVQDMVHEWLEPIPDGERENNWRQAILDRAAAKIEQTF